MPAWTIPLAALVVSGTTLLFTFFALRRTALCQHINFVEQKSTDLERRLKESAERAERAEKRLMDSEAELRELRQAGKGNSRR